MRNRFCAPAAVACVGGNDDLRGKVWFVPRDGGTLVIADIEGLPDTETGFFGFHIHEGGSCGGKDFSETGGHYGVGDHPKHAGDLPPLLGCKGRAYMEVLTDRFQAQEVIGRTVVIHSHPDDFHTQPSGNAGIKIACGVIRGA